MNKALRLIVGLLATLTPWVAFAQLQARDFDGNGAVDGWYDAQQDLTWLADQNYAVTSGWWFTNTSSAQLPSNDGRMTWNEAHSFAAQVDVAGVTGWRLPRLLADPTPNNAQLSNLGIPQVQSCSEIPFASLGMGNLCIGGANETSALAGSEALFLGLHNPIWIDATWRPQVGMTFFAFSGFGSPATFFNEQDLPTGIMLVRDGDVGHVAAVPEPSTYVLMLAGLGLMLIVRRKGGTKEGAGR